MWEARRRKEKTKLSSTFWNEQHFTGIVLILGSLLFLAGAGMYWPIKDEIGSFVF